jgi:hypothetical protein
MQEMIKEESNKVGKYLEQLEKNKQELRLEMERAIMRNEELE